MASPKEYSMQFKMMAQLDGSFNSAFKSGQATIASLQKEIVALNKEQSNIAAYQKQQGAMENTQKKLEMLQEQYNNIQKEIAETEGFSSSLENQLLTKQQQIEKTTGALEQQTQKYSQLGAALKEAGVDTGNLAQESEKLSRKITEVKQAQEEAARGANEFGSATQAAFTAAGQVIAAVGVAKALKEITGWYAECAAASREYESAMTGVEKTTDMTAKELAAMSGEIKALSTEIPLAASEIAEIAESAGQLGIAKDDITDFTRVMADLGVATNLSSTEAATQLAKFANITKMAASEYGALGSTVVALGNNLATTEADIVSMAMRLASAGSQAGMTQAQIISIAGALSSLGLEAQAGGSSFSKVISQMQVAVETGSGSLKDFAEVAGYTVEDFSRLFREDATAALGAFTKGLADTERLGVSATVMLEEMGITELRLSDSLKRVAGSGDLFANAISLGNEAWSENLALAKEAELRYSTTESQLIMMQNAYGNVKIAVGDVLNPELRKLYAIGNELMVEMAGFIERNPELVKGISVFVVAMGGAVTVITTATAAITLLKKAANAFNLATKASLGPVMVLVTAGAALIGVIAAVSSAMKDADYEARQLSATSRDQYYELQALTDEYKRAEEAYGATDDKTLALRYRMDELTASYEASKQTLKEFVAETSALVEAHGEIVSTYHQTIDAINNEEQGTLSLVFRLQELSKQSSLTAGEQEQLQLIINELNEDVPGLALSYDEMTQSMNMTTEAIKEIIKAQADRQRQEEKRQAWIDLLKEEAAITEQIEQAEANLLARRDQLTAEGWNVDAKYIGVNTDLDDYQDEVARLNALLAENEAALAAVTLELEQYTAQTEEAEAAQRALNAGSEEMQTIIGDATARLQELSDAYTKAYEAAYSSISGQYKLWEEAEKVVAISIEAFNKGMDSQTNYWRNYNANIESLLAHTDEVEGLKDLLIALSDGSTDSVNAIAGLASAKDADELARLTGKYQELVKEQKAASDLIGELKSGLAEGSQIIQEEMEAALEELEAGSKAAEAGRETIQGFIDGADAMLPQVEAVYAKVAKAALKQLGTVQEYSGGAYSGAYSGGNDGAGAYPMIHGSHALGLDYVPFDGYIAELHKGEKILTAAEAATAEYYTVAPYYVAAMAAISAQENAVTMDMSSYGGYGGHSTELQPVSVSVTVRIEGNATQETAERLSQAGDDIAQRVREVLEDVAMDDNRRRYS